MTTATIEAPVGHEISADEEFSRVLANLDYTLDDLREMDPDKQQEVLSSRDFIGSALRGEVEDVEPSKAWDYAVQYLDKLQIARNEKRDVFRRDQYSDAVLGELVRSLQDVEINSSDVDSYIGALQAVLTSDRPFGAVQLEAVEIIREQHLNIKKVADGDAADRYMTFLSDPKIFKQFAYMFQTCPLNASGEFGESTKNDIQLLAEVLEGVGIDDFEGCLKAWRISKTNKSGEIVGREIQAENDIVALAELEKARAGSVRLLHQFYGIRGFGRYPQKALMEQFDNHGRTDKPYGVVIGAVSDWNGAFDDGDDRALYRSPLTDEFNVRIIEAANKVELGRRIVALKRLYGNERRISFAVVNAHGYKGGFGLDDRFSQLGRISMDTKMTRNTAGLFEEDGLLVFQSCSTGQEDGIAQKVSGDLGITTIAPEENAGGKLVVDIRDGRLKIEPIYRMGRRYVDDDTNRFIDANMYINGEKIDASDPRYKEYFKEATEKQAT